MSGEDGGEGSGHDVAAPVRLGRAVRRPARAPATRPTLWIPRARERPDDGSRRERDRWASRPSSSSSEPRRRGGDGPPAVADPVLLRLGELGGRDALRQEEDRVVAEAAPLREARSRRVPSTTPLKISTARLAARPGVATASAQTIRARRSAWPCERLDQLRRLAPAPVPQRALRTPGPQSSAATSIPESSARRQQARGSRVRDRLGGRVLGIRVVAAPRPRARGRSRPA